MNTVDKPVVFFDGRCNLCNSSVDLLVRWDKNKRFFIGSLQGETARSLLSIEKRENLDSVVLYHKHKTYSKSSAAIRICAHLRWFLKPAGLLLILPKFIRDGLYNFIAKNRYTWFGRKETCRMPSDDEESYFLP